MDSTHFKERGYVLKTFTKELFVIKSPRLIQDCPIRVMGRIRVRLGFKISARILSCIKAAHVCSLRVRSGLGVGRGRRSDGALT